MFTDMKDRLKRFLELEQLNPSGLADILGIQRSGLSHILSGRNKPGFDLIHKLLIKYPSLNAEWLITGKGKVYKESSPAPLINPTGTLFESDAKATLFQKEEKSAENKDYEHISCEKTDSELPENSVNGFKKESVSEKKSLRKIIMIYTDNSFVEYFPGKD
jgi:transcriptional regulator with XRE-family HTH domain